MLSQLQLLLRGVVGDLLLILMLLACSSILQASSWLIGGHLSCRSLT
jgi:hypothetical protein